MKKVRNVLSVVLAFVLLLSTMQMSALAVEETGNSMQAALTRELNTEYDKLWTRSSGVYYKVTIPSKGFLSIYSTLPIDDEGETSYYGYTVYNSDGNKVWSGYTDGANPLATDYTMPVGLNGGTYYIYVDPAFSVYSGSIPQTYKFSFEAATDIEVEPNDTAATANTIELNKTYRGYTGETWNCADHFSINLKGNSIYRAYIDKYPGLAAGKFSMSVTNTSGSMYTEKLTDDGKYFLEIGVVLSGNYDIEIEGYDDIPYSEYTLRVEPLIEDFDGTSGKTGYNAGVAFDCELDTEYTKNWNKINDDYDCYTKVTIPDDGMLTWTIERHADDEGTYANYYVSVLDSDGNEITKTSTSGAPADAAVVTGNVGLHKGTYYVNYTADGYVESGLFPMKYKYTFEKRDDVILLPNGTEATAMPIEVDKVYAGSPAQQRFDSNSYFKVHLDKGDYRFYVNYKDDGYNQWKIPMDKTVTGASIDNESGSRYYKDFTVSESKDYVFYHEDDYYLPSEYTIEIHKHKWAEKENATPGVYDFEKTYVCTECGGTKTGYHDISVDETKTFNIPAENHGYSWSNNMVIIKFTPEKTDTYKLETVGAKYDTLINVYEDDLSTNVGYGWGNPDASVSCALTAGDTYYFAVRFDSSSDADRQLTVKLTGSDSLPEPTSAKPTEPATAEPAEPTSPEPTSAEPAPVKPTEPSTAKPVEPTTAKPAEPTTAKPAEPTTAKPTEQTTAKPAEQTTAKPAEPATKAPVPTTKAPAPTSKQPEPTSKSAGLRGDADLNGKVNAKDARLVLRASAKLETLSGQAFENADLNGDKKLKAGEARLILRYSAKLETTL